MSGSIAVGARVGRPAPVALVGCYFGAALACWLAATVALVLARDDLAAGTVWASRALLTVHLVALGFLPLAVSGGALHILPTLLRTDLSRWRGKAALPLLCAGPFLAYAIAYDVEGLLWVCALAETCGFVLIGWELVALATRAPRGRLLLASRVGIVLAVLHAALALTLGALLAAREDRSLLGIPHQRLIAIHLHLAVVGWLTLLLITVGRTLAPMLALAPAEPPRRWPVPEVALTLALWLLVAGFAFDVRPLETAGGAVVLAVLARFAVLLARVARERHLLAFEGPLLHFLAGLLFLVQAAVLGLGMTLGLAVTPRRLVAYVLVLLVGWAAGATLGHVGKLFSLSVWAWWPPGPRPKQGDLYPRRTWIAEAFAFAFGVEVVVDGVLAGSPRAVAGGGALLVAAALAAGAGVLVTLRAGALVFSLHGRTERYEGGSRSPRGPSVGSG